MLRAYFKVMKILWELKYDFSHFNMESFLRFVGEQKGRQMILIAWEMPMPSGLFGAWISDSESPNEYICYRSNLSPIHQIHVQLHELAHFLCGHPTLQINQELLKQIAVENATLDFAELPKFRSAYKPQIEAEAEILANIIQKRIIRYSQINQLAHISALEVKLADFLKMMGAM